MGCIHTVTFLRHLLLGIVLGTCNFVSSLINIYYLFKDGHKLFGSLSLCLLWFPGLVTSTAFLILCAQVNKAVLRLKRWKLGFYPTGLMLFYPIIPIVLTLAFIVTKNEKTHEKLQCQNSLLSS